MRRIYPIEVVVGYVLADVNREKRCDKLEKDKQRHRGIK